MTLLNFAKKKTQPPHTIKKMQVEYKVNTITIYNKYLLVKNLRIESSIINEIE